MNKDFFKLFLTMSVTFACKRLMQQIDLIMLAPLGEVEVAAYSAPMNFNIFDFAVFLSLAVVISVRLSKLSNQKSALINEISNITSFGILLGLVLSLSSLFIYRLLIDIQILNTQVKLLAQSVVPWCAINIIPDSACLFLSMIAFVTNRNKQVIIIALTSLCIDAILNYVLAYLLGMGFTGIFAATFITRTTEAILFFYVVMDLVIITKIKVIPDFAWVKRIIKITYPETFRIFLERVCIFLIYWMINRQYQVVEKLSVFAVTSSIRLVLGMFIIAYSRSISITLSKRFDSLNTTAQSWLKSITAVGLAFTCLIAISIWLGSNFLDYYVFRFYYPLSAYWWQVFCSVFIIILPLDFIVGVMRGAMNYLENYKIATLFDLILIWCVLLPIIALGLLKNNPYIIWSGYIINNLIFIFLAFFYLRRIHVNKHRQIITR